MLSYDYETENQSKWWIKWAIEITFFMLINVISLNIIFGIIIDTFAELRDAQKER